MNECQRKINMIIDVVMSACDTSLVLGGKKEVLKKNVFSKSKTEDAVRARTLLVVALKNYGYTNETICALLDITESAVRKMLSTHDFLKNTNRIYELTCLSVKYQIESYRGEDEAEIQKHVLEAAKIQTKG